MNPAIVVLVLLVLIVSQSVYALAPMKRRAYVVILALSILGIGAGQVWANAGLPAWRIGQAAILPGVLFALVLQPLNRVVPINLP